MVRVRDRVRVRVRIRARVSVFGRDGFGVSVGVQGWGMLPWGVLASALRGRSRLGY